MIRCARCNRLISLLRESPDPTICLPCVYRIEGPRVTPVGNLNDLLESAGDAPGDMDTNTPQSRNRIANGRAWIFVSAVGTAGFEPATPSPPDKHRPWRQRVADLTRKYLGKLRNSVTVSKLPRGGDETDCLAVFGCCDA